MTNAHTSTLELPGVGPKVADSLARLGISTIGELASYLPMRLEDRSVLRSVAALWPGEMVVISGTIKSVHQRKSKRGLTIIQAILADDSGEIPVLWFNQRYLIGQLRPGMALMVYGAKRLSPSLGNPFFVKKIITQPGMVPIYRTTRGLSQAMLGKLIGRAALLLRDQPSLLPNESRRKGEALVSAHHQPSLENLSVAKSILADEELLLLGLSIASSTIQTNRATTYPVDEKLLKRVTASLPYGLTDGQRRAAWEILKDIGTQSPMRRVMYGEVGSGKTIVSLLAAAIVAQAGGRVLILVPTSTLADQQALVARSILEPLGLRVAKRTGGHKEDDRRASVVIGTQALLQKSFETQADLIIIDEQQRFGVAERHYLLEQNPAAHLLLMTATPIPRSLAHILFGQMKLTYLRGKPSHQLPVTTQVFTDPERSVILADIGRRLKRGEPGYVICPLIDVDEEELIENYLQGERKTVDQEVRRLSEQFPAAKVAALHGRLKANQKEKILIDFKSGRIDILVATTVVEVGIDNPDASWILVEEADRFGLAQLHQLRGRVGRGQAASICYLAKREQISPYGAERLEAIQALDEGLALAEADLALRGPGELVGLEQSGLPRLRYADWREIEKTKRLFALAEKIVHDGIDQYPAVAAELKRYEQKIQIS